MEIKVNSSLTQNVSNLVNGENDGNFKLLGSSKAIIINEHEILKHWNSDSTIAANSGNIFLRPNGSENTSHQAVLNSSGNLTVDTITTNSGFGKKYYFEKQVTLTTDWQIILNYNDLPSGAYIIRVTGVQSASSKSWQDGNEWVGIMSWFGSQTNANEEGVISLHTTGHAHNGEILYLSTFNHGNSSGLNTTLEAKYSINWSDAHTMRLTIIKIA